MPAIGEKIGHVRVQSRLGRGGMGEVFLGFDEVLEREVAIKTLGENRRLDAEAKARLLREARLLSRLDHPGICRIHNLVEGDENDYLILEYIEGRTLRQMASRLTTYEVLEVFAEVAEALAAAHAQEIVHRDLKPENIMITPELRAKVLDFGIARSLYSLGNTPQNPEYTNQPPVPAEFDGKHEDDFETPLWPVQQKQADTPSTPSSNATMTQEGSILGTARYMSPEQARGERVDASSDMYSVGLMLQEVLTGQSAYGEAKGMELLVRAARAETTPVTDLDRDLTDLIENLKKLEPANRPSARDTAARLRWILDRPRRERRLRRRRILGLAAAAAALIAVSAIIWTELRSRRQVAIAQNFAAEARDITWMMRAEYLSPLHDLEPARERVRKRQEQLQEKMKTLGRQAKGPGELALGQVDLALRDFESARKHLDAAWADGVRTPEAAFTRALVYSYLYRGGIDKSQRIPDPGARQEAIDALARELRDPALEMLRTGDFDEVTAPAAYVEGLIAAIEERWEDALQTAAKLSSIAPWMYEAQVLEAECHYRLGQIASRGERDATRERIEFEQSRDAFRRAIDIGRSYPPAWARLCGVETLLAESRLYESFSSVQESDLEEVLTVCEQASMLQPNEPMPLMAMAGLSVLRARVVSARGDDSSTSWVAAQDFANSAIEKKPDDPSARLFGGWVSFWLASECLRTGADPSTDIRLAIKHYEAAAQMKPGDAEVATLLGEANWILNEWIRGRGGDPRPTIEHALEIMAPAITEAPQNDSLNVAHGNLLVLYGQAKTLNGDYEGAISTLEEALSIFRRIAEKTSATADLSAVGVANRHLAEALFQSGMDPTPQLEAAIEAFNRGLEKSPDNQEALVEKATVLEFVARSARLNQQPFEKTWQSSLEHLLRVCRKAPENVTAWYRLALARILEARWQIEDGASPQAALSSAEMALTNVRKLQPTWSETDRTAGELAMLRAFWQIARSLDPSSEFERAQNLLTKVAETSDADAKALELRAELNLEHARWAHKNGRSSADLIPQGIADAEAALVINSRSKDAATILEELRQLESNVENMQQ